MSRKMDYVFSPNGHKNTKMRVLEACSIAAYHRLTTIPVVSTLLSDDAPQFRKLTSQHANCWIHDGRNYKKLRPVVSLGVTQLGIIISFITISSLSELI